MQTNAQQDSLPLHIALLGYGGLIPFIFLALASWFLADFPADWFAWLLAYGAVIASFVGALHWGFAMTVATLSTHDRYQAFVCSVLPALLGFLALILNSAWSALLLVFAFGWAYSRDSLLAKHVHFAAWYMPLRLRLSLIASLSLVAGFFAQW